MKKRILSVSKSTSQRTRRLGQTWPSGQLCRNDHAPWPCDLYRWGHQVLWLAGWRDAEITQLRRQVEAGELPWA